MSIRANHGPDRVEALSHRFVDRCREAGYEAPIEWVRWLLQLELEAAARRDRVSLDRAARSMTLEHVNALADELIEVTSQAQADAPSCSPPSSTDPDAAHHRRS